MATITNVVLLAALCLWAAPTALAGYCSAYCDLDGYYRTGFYCMVSPNVYCCGNTNNRYCCANSTLDITGGYQDVYWCEHSSWWIFNWRVITGLLTTTLVVLLCSACCCKCCYSYQSRGRRRNPDDITTISDNVEETGEPAQAVVFNPESPYAFTPPDYSSLPKDPPKYHDLYTGGATGSLNYAYVFTEPQGAEMTSSVATASDVTGNDATAGVHDGPREAEQSEVPDEPPPCYSEIPPDSPPTDIPDGVTVETQSDTEV